MIKERPEITLADTFVPYDPAKSIYECTIANQNRVENDYVAFQHYGRNHTKSEMQNAIEACAAYYKNEIGVKRGDCYSIIAPTCMEAVIIFFALNKLGAIVNFVHPLLPAANIAEIMDLTKSKGVVLFENTCVVPGVLEMLGKRGVPALLICPKAYAYPAISMVSADEKIAAAISANIEKWDTYMDVVGKYSGVVVDGETGLGDEVALYMNGGGTTGKSRTIQLSNRAVNRLVYMLCLTNYPINEIGVDTEIGCMPLFHAFGFCAGCLTTINKGAKAVFFPKFDADQFIDVLKRERVTEFNGVPNMYRKLLAHPEFDGPHLASIRIIFSGGDDLRPAFLDEFRAVLRKNGSQAQIHQGYGLTECCAVCTNNRAWANKDGTIGQPLPGNDIEIWNDENEPVGYNTIGEIVIHGPAMMEGYLLENPGDDDGIFVDANGKKWVKSGDLGYYDEDGFLVFVGRKKRVIIISGYNVYPGDIEKLLTEVEEIRECCNVQGYDKDGKVIVRMYTCLNNPDIDKAAFEKKICDLIADRINGFSVPREFVYIDELPRTRVDKVDFMRMSQFNPTAPVFGK